MTNYDPNLLGRFRPRTPKSFWTYQAATPTPTLSEAKEVGAVAADTTLDDWLKLSPGMRREIVRSREETEVKTYTNPRTEATIENWPHGAKRVVAKFYVEVDPKRGERAVRVTTGAPKKLTFARKMRIVDGDDGRTYVAALTEYGHVTIHRGDMKFHEESIFERDERYPAALALFS